jgi:predicted Ser/Thr protein kinase
VIATGTILNGYRVERVLGAGGMGVVYEATQLSLRRRVALKVLRAPLDADEAFASRLRREGQLQASIEHPHVLDVYEVGESDDGLFLAMRLVEDGSSLASLLEGGDLDARRALDLLAQAASALDAAHAAGLVHGDVKPQNILVDGEGSAYLGDFGLTRAGGDSLTASRPLLGTVAYVAPELIRGQRAQPASDRYAFAATLFHCLTGDPVYPLGTDAAVMYAHVDSPPPRASERREELPAEVDDVFERGLAKEPDRRPPSAGALVDSVRDALGRERVEELGPPRLGGRAGRIPPTTDLARPPSGGSPKRSRLVLAAGAVLVAAVLGAGVATLVDDDAQGSDVPVPAVAASAQPLGSILAEPDRSVDCRGEAPSPRSDACAIAQTQLPGAELVVPADGMVVGWGVRGADGELALDVIRPRGPDTLRVGRSQVESAGNPAPHYFPAALPVETGDVLALELRPGASIGVRDADGAATERWFDPIGGFYGLPAEGEGTGFDHEISFRADFVPGGRLRQPPLLLGAAAAKAPPGKVRKQVPTLISEPRTRVDVAVVEVGGRVAMDVFDDGRRRARMFVPGLLPGGQPIDLQTFTYPGEGAAEAGLWWVNLNDGRAIFHNFSVYPRQIQLLG